jgi:hypothetical protein
MDPTIGRRMYMFYASDVAVIPQRPQSAMTYWPGYDGAFATSGILRHRANDRHPEKQM